MVTGISSAATSRVKLFVEDVHLLVGLVQALADPVSLPEGVGGLLPHLVGHLGHELHDASAPWAHVRPEVVHGPLGHVLGQVGAPLQLGDDQEQADQVAQLVTLDRPLLQLIPNEQLHLGGEGIDGLVPVDHRLAQEQLTVEEGVRGLGEGLGDQGEELDDLVVDGVETEVSGVSCHTKITHDVGFHPNLPNCGDLFTSTFTLRLPSVHLAPTE